MSRKLEETKQNLLEKVEALFQRKFVRIMGIIIGAGPIMYGGVTFLQGAGLRDNTIGFIAVVAGIALAITFLLSKSSVS